MAKKETKTNRKENTKNKKSFSKDFKAELKKVVWPTPKQLLNNTVAVITIVLITAAIVFVLDFVFESMNKHGIDKIKTVIDNTSTSENTSVSEDTIEMLEDIITTAINQTSGKAIKVMEEKMKAVTGGISIPGLF